MKLINKKVCSGLAGIILLCIGGFFGKNFGFDTNCYLQQEKIHSLVQGNRRLSEKKVSLETTVNTLEETANIANASLAICSSMVGSGQVVNLEDTSKTSGIIEGHLLYPPEKKFSTRLVCARNLSTDKVYCTHHHIESEKYQYRWGYRLRVPAGAYYVYSNDAPDTRAYYTDCNRPEALASEKDDPTCHDRLGIFWIESGETVTDINPYDLQACDHTHTARERNKEP